jgi:hypothetical protein
MGRDHILVEQGDVQNALHSISLQTRRRGQVHRLHDFLLRL